ncbi:MAG: signal recognition particle protein [Thermoleophilia bacterium]|nr:signal recognition particle protein [Thermoleophilia bacterium]
MFDSLSDKLQGVFSGLRGKGKLTEADIDQAMRAIRLSLLEADVNMAVVKQFTKSIAERAKGSEVMNSLTPDQQVVKIVNEELTTLMGESNVGVPFAQRPPTIVLMAGLQGSGKTTCCAKLARYYQQQGRAPMMVACDVHRPAAAQQLAVLGEQIDVPVYREDGSDAVGIARRGVDEARSKMRDLIIVDTAGRTVLDEQMMDELVEIRNTVKPTAVLLVLDSMTGQTAVEVAQAFQEAVQFDGAVLTKLDGDARGGAALSVRATTGRPIYFVGTGEKVDALEPFHPDRMASRILGMGDVLSLIEKAQQTIEVEDPKALEKKILGGGMTLHDFGQQLAQIRKMGPIGQLLGMMPGVGKKLKDVEVDERQIDRVQAIISSMTPSERRRPEIINGSRRQRIAAGSGTSVQEVNQLLSQFKQMRKMMKRMGRGGLPQLFGT